MQRLTSSVLSIASKRSFSSSRIRLSGHNKWSKIQQKKGAADARKGVVFGKAARDITVAVRLGGSADPTKNLQLAAVLKKARELDVPKENIEKALAKALQGNQGGNSFTYEALALESIGIIVECQTDNNNRTIHNIREILNGYGGHATPVKFMFERQGRVTVVPSEELGQKEGLKMEDEVDALVSHGLDNGAADFNEIRATEDPLPTIEFICEPSDIQGLKQSLQEGNTSWKVTGTELKYVPQNADTNVSEETKNALRELIDELEANEDVVQVATSLPGFP